jgi:hypothetical protein
MSDTISFAARMKRDGLAKCSHCGDWVNDVVPCTEHKSWMAGDVVLDGEGPAGDLCGECQKEFHAWPSEAA